ncbi:MAG: aspartate kinase [Deltaproteobacteria bacterium]|nr:MAG: aspartate kinase [Deltaproteobacteria bacterium]
MVLKFGGSSVADLDKIQKVADRVAQRAADQPVVVVVSAMGKTTRDLLARAAELTDAPTPRELDMLLSTGERASMALLALAIGARGIPVVSLTGSQCGIITDHRHGNARILEVRPYRVLDELDQGRVVVVGGFAGVSYRRDVTTIGRGGSDTTAVALAAAIGADCEIYSDVDGVYTADPRYVRDARRIDVLGADDMLALSRAGAKVLHAQAVALAAERGIAIYARKADGTGGQTEVRTNPASPAPPIRAVTCTDPAHAVEIHGLATGAAALRRLAHLRLSFVHLSPTGARGLWFPGRTSDPATERADMEQTAAATGARLQIGPPRALVAVVATQAEQAPEIFEALAGAAERAEAPIDGFVTDTNTLGLLTDPGLAHVVARDVHASLVTPPDRPARFPTHVD